jgi:hypothetical protein
MAVQQEHENEVVLLFNWRADFSRSPVPETGYYALLDPTTNDNIKLEEGDRLKITADMHRRNHRSWSDPTDGWTWDRENQRWLDQDVRIPSVDIASVGNPDGVDAALESIEPLDIVITLVTSDKPYRHEIMSLDQTCLVSVLRPRPAELGARVLGKTCYQAIQIGWIDWLIDWLYNQSINQSKGFKIINQSSC